MGFQNNKERVPQIGEVYLMKFGGSGSEQSGWRPGVVFQNNMGNAYSPNIIALPLTSSLKKTNQPTHVIIKAADSGLRRDSMVLCENPERMYRKYVQDEIGAKNIADIKYSDIKRFYIHLIKDIGFKPNSMEIIHTILHPVFNVAVRDGFIRTNPTDGVIAEIKKSHNWEKPKRHALTEAQQNRFLDFVSSSKTYKHWMPLFTVMLGTGARIGEILGLRWEDCDFTQNNIDINHNLIYRQQESGKMELHITTPKTRAGTRIIPMFSDVRAALLQIRLKHMEEGFNECEVDGYTNFIFKNRFGEMLNPHVINRALERIIRDCNAEETERAEQEHREPVLLPHFSAHNLRHTFCTRLCENETNLKVIQEIMGHRNIETTMDVYNEATKEKKMSSFANLEGKIRVS